MAFFSGRQRSGERRVSEANDSSDRGRCPPFLQIMYAEDMNKDEIKKQLEELAKKSPPGDLSPGAMCYSMAMIVGTVNITCSACGLNNLVPKSGQTKRYEQLTRLAQAVDMAVDNRYFCEKCKGEVEGLLLLLKVDGEEPRPVPITLERMKLLAAFLRGFDRYSGPTGRETAICEYVHVLKDMFGLA